ncbi:MAG TPA: DUF4123 domain-containing protein [Polyangiales bacterium]|nr:DUF4123 domain-containing protein [Polyangiales bacterium]
MADFSSSYLLRQLFYRYEPEGTELFAVLDGARSTEIYRNLQLSTLEYESLFSGRLSDKLRAASPFVVRLLPDDPFMDFLIEQGWGKSFGIFLSWKGGLTSLRRHLRTLLRVRAESGRYLFFRFYDPRVLRQFLPTCSAEQLGLVLGKIRRVDLEAADGGELWRFRTSSDTPPQLLRWQHTLQDATRSVQRD